MDSKLWVNQMQQHVQLIVSALWPTSTYLYTL